MWQIDTKKQQPQNKEATMLITTNPPKTDAEAILEPVLTNAIADAAKGAIRKVTERGIAAKLKHPNNVIWWVKIELQEELGVLKEATPMCSVVVNIVAPTSLRVALEWRTTSGNSAELVGFANLTREELGLVSGCM